MNYSISSHLSITFASFCNIAQPGACDVVVVSSNSCFLFPELFNEAVGIAVHKVLKIVQRIHTSAPLMSPSVYSQKVLEQFGIFDLNPTLKMLMISMVLVM
jgi:hypothetical protein